MITGMRFYKITFEDGNTIRTGFNGNFHEADMYYRNQVFNFGDTDECPHDKLVKAVKVEEL
jgi:hypothetical protein